MRTALVIRLFLLLLIGAGLVVAIVYRGHLTPGQLRGLVDGLGMWGPVAFVGLWLMASVFFIPGTALTAAGGALFGPLWGPVYSLVGGVTGASLAYGVGRFLGRGWVGRNVDGYLGRFKAGVEAEGWRFGAFVRLVPVAPFNLLNLGLGLTRIPLRTYVFTTLLCMVPGTLGYSYLGYAGRQALLGGRGWISSAAVAVAVLAVLVFLPLFVRRLRAMRRAARMSRGAPGLPAEGDHRSEPGTQWVEANEPQPEPEGRA